MVRTLASLILLVTLAGPAHADGWYFVEGVGQPRVEGELGTRLEGLFAFRVALGHRVDRIAVEGYVQVGAFDGIGAFEGGSYSTATFGVDLKYLMPVTRHLEVYLRGGLNRMLLEGGGWNDPADAAGYAGRGLTYGAGVQISGKVPVLGFLWFPLFFTDLGPKVTSGLWFDTSNQIVRLHKPGRRSLDGDLPTWTLGFAIGSDF
jgi:hypothetical protein